KVPIGFPVLPSTFATWMSYGAVLGCHGGGKNQIASLDWYRRSLVVEASIFVITLPVSTSRIRASNSGGCSQMMRLPSGDIAMSRPPNSLTFLGFSAMVQI